MFNPKVVTLSPATRAAVLRMLAAHGNRGGGWVMAGRSGKRDRRCWNGYVADNSPPRTEGKDAGAIALLRQPLPPPPLRPAPA